MNKAKEFIKSKKGKIIIAASAAVFVVIIVAIVLLLSKKEDKEAYRTISVSALSGTVMAENNGSEYKAYEDMKLHEGYALRTESDSFARLVLDNDKYIKLEENSKATFEKLGKDKTGYTTINLQYGAITNEITEPLSEDDEYMIHTPNAVFAVRGTFFRVEVAENESGEILTDVYAYGGTVASKRITPEGEVVEETVEVAATCTKAGSKVTRCSVCLEQFSKTEIPALGHGKKDEKVVSAATCSKEGTKEIKCTVCGQVTGNESIPKLKHTEVEESIEATFAAAGSYKKSCSVCKTVLETKSISKLPAIYTDEGDIFITSSGYYTSSDMTHVPYTGDYVISQKSSSRVPCSIYIEGGEHNVTLDGINITGCFDVSAEADVSLYGTTKANYITLENGVAAINNSASLDICSGNITAKSTSYGLRNYENACISGGNLTFEGGTADVNAGSLYILGGSVKLVNDTMSGTAYNGSTKLECFVYNAYPLDYQLKYPLKNGDISYVSVGKTDVNADGKFYIWKSAEDLVINEKTFPDANIRTYINNNFDSDYNGYLSDTEIENATQLIMYNAVSSFEGVQYLTGLEILQCYGDITATKIEMRTLTNLQKLDLTNAPILNIELYNCVDLMELNLSGTRISYLDLGWCGKLISLNVRNCPLACINLEDTPIDVSGFQTADNIYKYNGTNVTSIAVRNILGLNASKITHVTGADFDATTETFTNITGNKINYLYDCGNGVTATFSIQIGN